MSSAEWEDFTLEYAHSLKSEYRDVQRHASAGDMGCDVVAYANVPAGVWDNYQCKHYNRALQPTDGLEEIGKCCYYAWRGEYSWPRAYYFVAPRGAGTTFAKLLKDSKSLKSELTSRWNTLCRHKILANGEVKLEGQFAMFVKQADFSIFSALSPLTAIERHARTPWHAVRFGGGLKARPLPLKPPLAPADTESGYIRCLLDAYEEQLGYSLAAISDLKDIDLTEHLQRARREFYSAESLREFSRDNVPVGTFENLLDEVYSGVIDIVEATHPNAMARVRACVGHAKALALASNALVSTITTADKGGMCHQLANSPERNFKWRR